MQEHTFEVSLFSELFNEMLMRDFGMLIYRSVVNDGLKKKDKKDDDRKKISVASLLLAYCYFDVSHCNSITSKDLEDLFLTLGMQLSRAQVARSRMSFLLVLRIVTCVCEQVRNILQKVIVDDTLRYRKLIERASSPGKDEEDQYINTQSRKSLNKHVNSTATYGGLTFTLSATAAKEVCEDDVNGASEQVGVSGLVLSSGCYVNVDQLLLRFEQSEESRRESEKHFRSAQGQLGN